MQLRASQLAHEDNHTLGAETWHVLLGRYPWASQSQLAIPSSLIFPCPHQSVLVINLTSRLSSTADY